MDEARVKQLKEAALRERRKKGPPPRVCPGCGRLTRPVGEGLCGPCLRRLNAGPAPTHPHEARDGPPAFPGAGQRGRRTPRQRAGDLPVRALALLPLPGPARPKHLTDAERRHRVSVYALQLEEMLAEGVLRPIDYSDPRLWPPDAGLSLPTDAHDEEDPDGD